MIEDGRGEEPLEDELELSALGRTQSTGALAHCLGAGVLHPKGPLATGRGEHEARRATVGTGPPDHQPVVDEAVDEADRRGVREPERHPERLDRAPGRP